MSNPSLKEQFGTDFAGSAFRREDGEDKIVGKIGEIVQLDDGTFDAWFVGKGLEPLSERKITALCKKLRQGEQPHRATGEMWVQGRDRDFVLRAASLCGVKKKPRQSAEHQEKSRRQLEKLREG